MHNKEIKTFYLEGIISDDNLMVTRERLIVNAESDMRDAGYVPVLDLDPLFTLDYQPKEEHYLFQLTLYGAYVGRDEAWAIGGTMNGKMIPKHIPQPKLNQSSITSE